MQQIVAIIGGILAIITVLLGWYHDWFKPSDQKGVETTITTETEHSSGEEKKAVSPENGQVTQHKPITEPKKRDVINHTERDIEAGVVDIERTAEEKGTKICATGESGFKMNPQMAKKEAKENAYNELLHKINKSSTTYEIEKDTVYPVEGEGYKAKIVIFTYK